MTPWEWQCVVKGWNRSQGGEAEKTFPTNDEFERAVAAARMH